MRSSWTVFEDDYWAIRGVLSELLECSNSSSVMLIDHSGQIISSLGTPADFDMVSFASLCAADFEANRQLAQLIGENDFTTLYHQGANESMYLSRVEPAVIIAVLFDRTTTLGLVRLRVKRAADQLSILFMDLNRKARTQAVTLALEVDGEFAAHAEAEIDNLFRD